MVGTVRAEDVVVLFLALVMVAILVGLYLLPSIVAATRRVPHAGPVVVVNVFLGWTLIGWVVALALALRDLPRPRESTTSYA
jgi:hypothetical protein